MNFSKKKYFFAFLFLINTFIYAQTFSYKIDAINPASKEFPGGRGADQLIVYTTNYPNKSTGTNQYGIEICVHADRVISLSENDSEIPINGMVISGHGKAKKWLLDNAKVGAKIQVIDSVIYLSIDLESLCRNTQYKIEKAQSYYDKLSQTLTGIDHYLVGSRIEAIQMISGTINQYFVTRDSLSVLKNLAIIDSLLLEIKFLTSESPRFEARGVWYRPVERSRDDIIKTLERMKRANMNILFLEALWNGETIYPSEITQQKKIFTHFDPLKIFIEEGEKRGIEVHAWNHTFFVGYVGKTDTVRIGPILEKHPDWAIIKRDGTKISTSEDGYLYVCPARPEVQDLIASIYHEILVKYPKIGGIQLDYIRYPTSNSLKESYCYCEYCRKEFKKIYKTDPMKITPEKNPDLWKNWENWRRENITNFVERIRNENKTAKLSADVFPDTLESKKTVMQDWIRWANLNYLDIVAPMVYTTDSKWLNNKLSEMKKVLKKDQIIYCGLAPFLDLTPEMLLEQINIARNNKMDGIILFSLAYLSDKELDLLKLGPFREPALLPHYYKN